MPKLGAYLSSSSSKRRGEDGSSSDSSSGDEIEEEEGEEEEEGATTTTTTMTTSSSSKMKTKTRSSPPSMYPPPKPGKTGKELYDEIPKYIRDKIINPEVLINWKPTEDGEDMPEPEFEPVPSHPPRKKCPEGTELPYPWESEVGKPLPNERLIRKMLAVPKRYRQPDGSLGPTPRPKNPWTVANRKEFSDLVHYCRTTGGLSEADGYKNGVSYRYNIGCTWTQHRLYMEQIHQYPETNERGEWFGFDPKKIHPIDDDPTHFITKAKADSYRELEKRGINGTTLEEMFKERTLDKSGGWHWNDGTVPSHSDGGPKNVQDNDIDSEPEDPETAECPESLKWVEERIAREKEEKQRKERDDYVEDGPRA